MNAVRGWPTIACAMLATLVSCTSSAAPAKPAGSERQGAAAPAGAHAYLIAQVATRDFMRFQKEYGERAIPVLQRYGARPIVATQVVDLREGSWTGDWTVVMEFPSRAAATGYYASSDYQRLIPVRQSLTQFGHIVLVDGLSTHGAAEQTDGKSYLIGRVDVRDVERFRRDYGDKVGVLLQRTGARVLVASPTVDLREGNWPANWTVVIEFPSREAADGFYQSAEYQALIPVRRSVSRSGSILFADGFSVPPAPASE